MFRIRVPADFGDRELVWTLTTNGRTERAYATLKRDYFIDDLVIQANYGAGGGAGTTPELPDNQAPTLAIEGGETRTVRAGEPLELAALSTDDGKPRARAMPASNPRHPGRFTTDTATGHRLSWFVYRGAGEVAFDPPQIKVWEDTRDTGESPWSPGWTTPPRSRGRALDRRGHVRRAGRLRAARPGARRRAGHRGGHRRHRHALTTPRLTPGRRLRPLPAPDQATVRPAPAAGAACAGR